MGRLLLPFRTHRCNYAKMAADRYYEHPTGHGVDVRVGWYFRRIVVRSSRALYAKGLAVVLLDGWRMFREQSIPYTPPGCCNANADVESNHGLIE